MQRIGTLDIVPLRKVWENEERGFSQWLENNIEVLADTLDISLVEVQREKSAGDFEVDLVAEDGRGEVVIIENQIEPTDHRHLGQVLTYLSNMEEKTAIWITSNPRPEHARAIAWLNESTPPDTAFYLVKLATYKIGNSDPAPLFTVIVEPSDETKSIGQSKKDLAERHHLRIRFWQQLLDRAKSQGVAIHSSRSPTKEHWISAGAGKTGLAFNYVVWSKDRTAVELYIDTVDVETNKRHFDSLASMRAQIEEQFGEELQWERLNQRRASRVRHVIEEGGLKSDEDNWPHIQDVMIKAMVNFVSSLKPHIDGLE